MGETNFQTREFPRSGSKAKEGEKKREREKKKEKKTLNDGNNNGQLRIATPPRADAAHAKPPGSIQGGLVITNNLSLKKLPYFQILFLAVIQLIRFVSLISVFGTHKIS